MSAYQPQISGGKDANGNIQGVLQNNLPTTTTTLTDSYQPQISGGKDANGNIQGVYKSTEIPKGVYVVGALIVLFVIMKR